MNKYAPQRTCVACRQVKNKQELVRLVHIPDDGVEIDESGRKTGRGAYICRVRECWVTGLNRGHLERALRTTLNPGNRERLSEYGEDLPGGAG